MVTELGSDISELGFQMQPQVITRTDFLLKKCVNSSLITISIMYLFLPWIESFFNLGSVKVVMKSVHRPNFT